MPVSFTEVIRTNGDPGSIKFEWHPKSDSSATTITKWIILPKTQVALGAQRTDSEDRQRSHLSQLLAGREPYWACRA